MAYSKAKTNTEHPYKTIVKLVQSGIYPKVMLFYGHEEFLINWAGDFLRSKLINPAVESFDFTVFSGESLNYGELVSACETLPIMSEKKLVIVEECDIFSAQSPSDLSKDEIEELCNYLKSIPETTLLLFISPKINKTKAIYKAVAKLGIAYDFEPLDRNTLGGWVQKQLQGMGKKISSADALGYADICGYFAKDSEYTLYNVRGDLKKAAALCDGETVKLEDLKLCMQGEDETDAFAILDAAFSGKKGEALTILHNKIDAEQLSKQQGVIISFTGLLCSQLEIMVEARERSAGMDSENDIAAAMGVNPYRVKAAMRSSAKKSLPQLKESLLSAYEIEKNFKGGILSPHLALEMFIAAL